MTEPVHVVPKSMKVMYDFLHFSPAVIDGATIRCSGVVGVDMSTRPPSYPSDPETQFALAFQNLETVLTEAGATMADVTEITTYHVGLQEHMEAFTKVKDRFIAEPYPAWTAIGITELVAPGAWLEIKAIARRPE
jgi:enamine deaminase RidA (YjgF/YER057c/UK114 family)